MAADLGPLRGTQVGDPLSPIHSWEGGYIGGFAGISHADYEFAPGLRDIVGNLMRHTTLEKEFVVSGYLNPVAKSARETSFGVFAGYNVQFDDIVFGIEADYTRARLIGEGHDAIARAMRTSDDIHHEIYLTGTAKTEIKDYGTLRARIGYTFGSFMPFLTAGVAVGQAEVTRGAEVQQAWYNIGEYNRYVSAWNAAVIANAQGTPTPYPAPFRNSVGYRLVEPQLLLDDRSAWASYKQAHAESSVAIGIAIGAGVDVALSQNIFLRGEVQHVAFDDLDKQTMTATTVRGGAGVKF